jgi:DNA-binding MarR family transcriptional regulator
MNKELFNVIERLANLLRQEVRAEGQSLGLQPVQQEALYYLSICNRYSDTTLAVTEYLGLTKGTVSQSLKVLENKELIYKEKDTNDLRITHLKVTAAGQQFLTDTSPPKKFREAIALLAEDNQIITANLLQDVLKNYQQVTGRSAFGVCKNCKYNQPYSDGIMCKLTNEPLSNSDIVLICREYDT